MTATVASPCVSVCLLDRDRDRCLGCHRTRAEIAEWSRADDDRRREILDAAQARRGLPETTPPE